MHLAAVLPGCSAAGALGSSGYRAEHLISAMPGLSALPAPVKRRFAGPERLISAMRRLSAQPTSVKWR